MKDLISGNLWTLVLGTPSWSPSVFVANTWTLFSCPKTLWKGGAAAQRRRPCPGLSLCQLPQKLRSCTKFATLRWECHMGTTAGTSRLSAADTPPRDCLPSRNNRNSGSFQLHFSAQGKQVLALVHLLGPSPVPPPPRDPRTSRETRTSLPSSIPLSSCVCFFCLAFCSSLSLFSNSLCLCVCLLSLSLYLPLFLSVFSQLLCLPQSLCFYTFSATSPTCPSLPLSASLLDFSVSVRLDDGAMAWRNVAAS